MKIYSCETLLYAGDIIDESSMNGDDLDHEEAKKLNFENLLLTEQKLRNSIKNRNAGTIEGKISFEPHFLDEAIYKVKFDLVPSVDIIDIIDNNPGQPEFYLGGLSSYGPDVTPNPGDNSLEIWVVKQKIKSLNSQCKWSRSCSMTGEKKKKINESNSWNPTQKTLDQVMEQRIKSQAIITRMGKLF